MLPSFHPTNWSKACVHWIHEIQVVFEPPVPVAVGTGGFLRRTRLGAPQVAALVVLAFTLHCTRPPATFTPRRPISEPLPASPGHPAYVEEGVASWYGGDGDGFAGQPTASGESYDPDRYTCAHRTLPLGTLVEVKNLENGKHAIFRVNDRGPFTKGRILDLSRRGAEVLGFIGKGVARISLQTVNAQGAPVALDPALDRQDPYVVQVAALANPEHVQALKDQLEDTFGPVTTQDATTGRGLQVKRVRVGSYTNRQDAEKAAQQIARLLKDRGVEPFITRRR
ncbi:MAG TPA: septal ring lytic transglycosylase RlpA family protein [Holophagaceae bacterium]